MHEANMTSDTFNVKLIQVVYGRKYNFILLVDIYCSIFEKGIIWIKTNYKGIKNWIKEFNGAIEDLKSFGKTGKANLLSKMTELKTSRIGIHYDEGNFYQRKIIHNSHAIDVSKLGLIKIEGSKIINFEKNLNYYYFYLNNGEGEINILHFSGKSSSLVIYSDDSSEKINITSLWTLKYKELIVFLMINQK